MDPNLVRFSSKKGVGLEICERGVKLKQINKAGVQYIIMRLFNEVLNIDLFWELCVKHVLKCNNSKYGNHILMCLYSIIWTRLIIQNRFAKLIYCQSRLGINEIHFTLRNQFPALYFMFLSSSVGRRQKYKKCTAVCSEIRSNANTLFNQGFPPCLILHFLVDISLP